MPNWYGVTHQPAGLASSRNVWLTDAIAANEAMVRRRFRELDKKNYAILDELFDQQMRQPGVFTQFDAKPADARPCSGAGIDFGGVALGSPDDRSKTIPAP